MHVKSGVGNPGARDDKGVLLHRQAREWVDMGSTGPTTSSLPEDVRMPYRSGGISQYTGARYAAPDKEVCHIDTTPSEIGQHSEADVTDKSRHGGTNHLWNSHPHANSPRFEPNTGMLGRAQWVPDGKGGYRSIDILSVTLPHDCENHLVGV